MLKNIKDETITDVWHNDYFEICKLRLSDDSYNLMINEIHAILDKNLEDKTKLIVKSIIPKKRWLNTVWEEALSKACAYDECYAGHFIGLLVCQELIKRKETWYFLKKDLSSNMQYFVK